MVVNREKEKSFSDPTPSNYFKMMFGASTPFIYLLLAIAIFKF